MDEDEFFSWARGLALSSCRTRRRGSSVVPFEAAVRAGVATCVGFSSQRVRVWFYVVKSVCLTPGVHLPAAAASRAARFSLELYPCVDGRYRAGLVQRLVRQHARRAAKTCAGHRVKAYRCDRLVVEDGRRTSLRAVSFRRETNGVNVEVVAASDGAAVLTAVNGTIASNLRMPSTCCVDMFATREPGGPQRVSTSVDHIEKFRTALHL